MFKSKFNKIKEYQEKVTFYYAKKIINKHPETFGDWSDEKLTRFVKYTINPKRTRLSRSEKKEFEQVSKIKLDLKEAKELFK